MQSKICGVKDSETLNFLINYKYPPELIGFICNYPKSSRYIKTNALKILLNVNKNKSKFVAVLVKPDDKILEEIKNLPFDYYQLYDCSPDKVRFIKKEYNKKIITGNFGGDIYIRNYFFETIYSENQNHLYICT